MFIIIHHIIEMVLGQLSKETFVRVDFCPRRLLSKDTFVQGMYVQGTFVQGDFCPIRLLSKETFAQGDYCPSINEHARTVYWSTQTRGKQKYIMRFEIR